MKRIKERIHNQGWNVEIAIIIQQIYFTYWKFAESLFVVYTYSILLICFEIYMIWDDIDDTIYKKNNIIFFCIL